MLINGDMAKHISVLPMEKIIMIDFIFDDRIYTTFWFRIISANENVSVVLIEPNEIDSIICYPVYPEFNCYIITCLHTMERQQIRATNKINGDIFKLVNMFFRFFSVLFCFRYGAEC